MRKRPRRAEGRLLELEHRSRVLRDNPLGDPWVRRLHVWLPPQYDEGSGRGRGRRFPVLFDLVGYTGSGFSHTSWRAFDENVPERAARLVAEGRMAPAILVFPDCFTALGGNQYVDSAGVGRYASYLTRELVPFVDGELRTRADREHRGCFGKSSGGYGAIVHGMKHATTWGAVADHSGDAHFDFVYRTDWPQALDVLARYASPRSGDRAARFLKDVWSRAKLSGGDVLTLMLLCMAASYDPDPDDPRRIRLPFDPDTGELRPERWRRWLAHDPVRMVTRYRGNLRKLRGIWIDCGSRDEYRIHYGCRILSRRLREAGIRHTYEEFDDTHSGIDYRMDRSLPFLTRALR